MIPFLSCNPTYGGQCPPCCSLPGFSFLLMEGSNHIPDMQTIHFSQVGFVEYGDNYYSYLETAYIFAEICRYLWREVSALTETQSTQTNTAARRISCPANSDHKCDSRINNQHDHTEVISAYTIFTAQTNRVKPVIRLFDYSAHTRCVCALCVSARCNRMIG